MKALVVFLVIALLPTAAFAQEQVELASQETRYGDFGRYRGRAHNIRHAGNMISDVILQPQEEFSFNERIGQRTRARGFRRAPVIISGRIGRDYGGGICQLASTIYAAALYSGLHVIEHHAHSRVSSYIRPGLDATVDWGTKDLIIQNPFPFPVTMNVSFRAGDRPAEELVAVSFVAARQIYDVQIHFRRRIIEQYDTIEEFDESLEPGERHIDEPGTPGMRVTVWRRLTPHLAIIQPIRERHAYIYPASNRIVFVGPPVE